jgi:GT2 family glycosyltransferase/glycosyltransferase involved in cell wall biosynthesis
VSELARPDQLPDNARLAHEAFDRAQAEAAAGNAAQAQQWLDRATRLTPRDQTLALALATACLGQDDRRAARLFAAISTASDVREAWLGLATAYRRLGDVHAAAAALAAALARHVPDNSLSALADAIVREAGMPGWCGLTGDGTLVVQTTGSSTDLRFRLDGRRITPKAGRPLRTWEAAHWLTVTTGERHLLGSPIDIHAIRRVVGCVACRDGNLEGWAWHPANPDANPVLTIRSAGTGKEIAIIAGDTTIQIDANVPLARPRGFRLSAAELADLGGPLHVRGADGRDLLGSPLDPGEEQRITAAAAVALARRYPTKATHERRRIVAVPPAMLADVPGPRPPIGAAPRRRSTSIVVPVHNGATLALACLDSVLADLSPPDRLIVVDDASTDPALARALDALVAAGRIHLLRHRHNLGFPASANIGLSATIGRDVVLLNSDTLVAPGWLEDLREAAYSAPDIGSVTPLSNDATILSYPGPSGSNPLPDAVQTRRLAALARRVNHGIVVDIPVAVGFCMYIRRDCLDAVGLLRADVFAQGYGEENDFCLRARHLGWRHVAAPGVFVAHVGGHSFGSATQHLQARNTALLARLHPGYAQLVEAFAIAEPLAPARRRLDLARWRAARDRNAEAVILVSHTGGGGVETQIAAACARHQAAGSRAIVLRPTQLPDGSKAVLICDGTANDYPNLRFALPAEASALQRFLSQQRPHGIEIHHMVGHDPAILDVISGLDVPYDVHVHDYAWLCGRIALVGPDQRYCGEPPVHRCEACVADAGNLIDEDITVARLRRRSGGLFAGARCVVTPSKDTAIRINRHFPDISPQVTPHDDDAQIAEPPRPTGVRGRCRVCVIGAIGVHKGYQVLLDCARDAAERNLPLDFVVVGHTIDDRRLLATQRVFVTGSYQYDEVEHLIRVQQASLAWLPSIFPETWCLSLAEAWRAGLHVAAFDIGAQAERIRDTGYGFLLPLGLSASAINNALVAAAGLSRHE